VADLGLGDADEVDLAHDGGDGRAVVEDAPGRVQRETDGGIRLGAIGGGRADRFGVAAFDPDGGWFAGCGEARQGGLRGGGGGEFGQVGLELRGGDVSLFRIWVSPRTPAGSAAPSYSP
jgi:hypothetical protein